jgi:cob(I)alamin adenosyltransferase
MALEEIEPPGQLINIKKPGRFLIFTGDGKGKTTAALGLVLRASGHGQKVFILQFLKSQRPTGERLGLIHLPGVERMSGGLGFLPGPKSSVFKAHQEAAEKSLNVALEMLKSGRYDLVVLDEIITAISKGVLSEDRVLEVIRQRSKNTHLVMTGRGMSDRLMDQADTVTQMNCLKHGLQQGLKAQPGIEY